MAGGGRLAVWELGSAQSDQPKPKVLAQLGGGFDPVRFSPDGRFLATSESRRIIIYDVRGKDRLKESQTLKEIDSGEAHADTINHIDFSPDGTLVVSGSAEGNLKLWDLGTGRRLATIPTGGKDRVHPVFSPSGTSLAVAHLETNTVWEITGKDIMTAYAPHPDPVRAFAFDPSGGSRIAVVSGRRDPAGNSLSQTASVWRALVARPEAEFLRDVVIPQGYPIAADRLLLSLAYSPRGDSIAFARPEGVHIWDINEGEPRRLTSDLAVGLSYSWDGGRHWGIVNDYEVRSWSPEGPLLPTRWFDQIRNLAATHSALDSIVAGNRWALASALDNSVLLMRRSDGQREHDLVSLESRPSALALSRDETVAAIGLQTGQIRLVRVPDGTLLAQITGHRDVVLALALSPDGSLLASSGRDRSLHLWDCAQRQPVKLLTLPNPVERPILAIGWRPDGKTLGLLGENDRVVRLLRIDLLRAQLKAMRLDWENGRTR